MRITYAKKEELNIIQNIDIFISENQLLQAIKQKRVYVIKEDNKIIGFLRYTFHLDQTPLLCFIYVNPKYRKQGIATKLIKKFEKDMIKQQYDTILLSVPSKSEAIDFFKHLNFKQIGYTNISYETEELIFENILINRDVF